MESKTQNISIKVKGAFHKMWLFNGNDSIKSSIKWIIKRAIINETLCMTTWTNNNNKLVWIMNLDNERWH